MILKYIFIFGPQVTKGLLDPLDSEVLLGLLEIMDFQVK